eukprot:TRINITY_DN27021_c0_g2_i1.p1 TRINITY_DN27021_c0_g2~~TRINITY_DN27021_c0_g2_i1.p1  ORF type:complete len:590 (+),score=141.65 TRINITY_DN27021_c0_g2_i1:208-1977(+)
MFQAIANFFGFGDEDETEVTAEDLRGPGVHKWEFLGRRDDARLEDVYFIEGEIGRGAFGKVLAIKNRATSRGAVCKLIPKGPSREQTAVRSEIELIRTLDHPNIVRMFEYFEDRKSFYIVFERISGGDLQAEVRGTRYGLDEKTVARYVRQVLLAINYCHSLVTPVVHRDLKPANVMRIGHAGSTMGFIPGVSDIKLIDFGLGMLAGDDLSRVCGTPVFMAPEVFDGKYGKEADIYAVGMMMYYLLTKELPFASVPSNLEDFRKMLGSFQIDFPERHGWKARRLRLARDLVACMLSMDRKARPTAAQALKSEYLMKHAPSTGLGWRGYSRKLVTGLSGYATAPPVLRVVLLVAASQVDQAEMGKMRRQFVAIDRDGDGFISGEDLRTLLKQRSEAEDLSPAVLQVADLDGDGVVSFSEFVAAWLYGRLERNTDCVSHAFEIIDRDHDGLVTREDVFEALNTPQMRQLGGSKALAESVSDIFPPRRRLDCKTFTALLLQHEPVRLGLRFTRPRHRQLYEDNCAPICGFGRRSSQTASEAVGDGSVGGLRWRNATARQQSIDSARSSSEDEYSSDAESGGEESFWQRLWRA